MSDKDTIAKPPSGRVTRTPIGRRNLLNVRNKDPEYQYRIVNDKEDRIQTFQEAGWELVTDGDVTVGDKRVTKASAEGTPKKVSVGQGMQAYVMRIRKDWFEEDQARKAAYVNEIESAMKAKALDGTYGKLEITRD